MNPRSACSAVAAALVMLACTGCAFKVIRTPPLVITSATGGEQVVKYPAYVLVHDPQSRWDAHQIKDNIVGLFDGEVVHWLDLGLDSATPGPDRLPLQHGIEWIKNEYAQLPDCAPVRIVGGFFSAFAIEKTTLLGGVRIASAPGEPISYFLVTRVIYLTDWVQDTLGEANAGLGHLVPWEGSFFPSFVTAPINDVVDWAQSGAITGYTWVFRQINIGVDDILYGWEWVWGGVVSLFVDVGSADDEETSESAPVSR